MDEGIFAHITRLHDPWPMSDPGIEVAALIGGIYTNVLLSAAMKTGIPAAE